VAERRGTFFLLLGMLAWIAAGFAGALLTAGLWAGGAVLLRGPLGYSSVPMPSQLAFVLIATTGFQGTLLLAAWWQGRRAGNGDRQAGLGIGPIRHPGTIVWLCVAMVGWLIVFVILADAIPALREFARSVTPESLFGLGGGGPGIVALKVVLVTMLAPASEELLFRGWLWEAVRRRGHAVVMTAVLTATPWLLLHGIDQPGRILFLLPAAVIFSIARHRGGGVLASLTVHVSNNSTAVLMQAVAEYLGATS
jgi:membrane protease YdiL (CAAX protease family)